MSYIHTFMNGFDCDSTFEVPWALPEDGLGDWDDRWEFLVYSPYNLLTTSLWTSLAQYHSYHHKPSCMPIPQIDIYSEDIKL